MDALLIGGSRDGETVRIPERMPVLHIPKRSPVRATALSEPLSALHDLPEVELYTAVRIRPPHQRDFVYLSRDTYAKFARYTSHAMNTGGDIPALALRIANVLVTPGVPPRIRWREVEVLERQWRILELKAKFAMPDPWALQVEHVLAAEVWYCGDDYCGCSSAQIVTWADQGPLRHRWPGARFGLRAVWRGPFHTEHESGAVDDLALAREYLGLVAPDLLRRIE